jgi:SAM-dependent methyltransferase
MSGRADPGLGMHRSSLILAGALTSLGERFDLGWLTYNPLQMLIYHRYAVREAPGVIRTFEELFPEARTYVDIGCGSGAFAAEAVRRGHRTIGLERSRAGRAIAHHQGVHCEHFDLRKGRPVLDTTTFDLAYCLEVAEHLPAQLAEQLVEVVCGLAPRIVFSAAPPGQGGVGHINEQPPEYWHAIFRRNGRQYDPTASETIRQGFERNGVAAPWLKGNTVVYVGSD